MEPIDIKLKKLWDAGKTSSAIAEALGMSRSAVMGRIFRLRAKGIEFAARPSIRGPSKPKREQPSAPSTTVEKMPFVMPKFPPKSHLRLVKNEPEPLKAPEPPPAPEPPKKPNYVTLMELNFDHCRYIVKTSKTRGPLYCGEPKKIRAYCAEHAALCYVVLRKGERPNRPPGSNQFVLEPLGKSGF